jgi:hypothetical protein
MRSRARVSSLVVLLCVVVGGLALSGGVASARLVHLPVGSFGPEGPGPSVFSTVEGVAVDQASGDVYVYDAGGSASIYKFNAAGEPAEFSGLHADVIPNVGRGGYAGNDEQELAVDSSGGATAGDIYLANGGNVAVYGPDGVLRGELNGEVAGPWGEPCGVAVDPAGHVYVGLASGNVNRYAPSALEDHATNGDYTSSLSGLTGEICNVAVDAAETVYADTWEHGPVTKYFGFLSAGGEALGGGSTLAVDPSNDDVYVDQVSQVTQYSSLGESLGTITGLSGSFGVAVNRTSGEVYVADGSGTRVDIFGPSVPLPDVGTGSAVNLHVSSATVTGAVNPHGLQVTSCQFEYGTSTAYGSTAPCAQAPGSGSAVVHVSAELGGLQENTTYHFRLDATNANGENQGQDWTFTPPVLPVIDEESAGSIGTSTVTFAGQVNPQGSDTTYRFEYGPDTGYGTSIPVPDGDLGSGSTDQVIHRQVSGLQSGATYHYRLVASNAAGEVQGPDRVFKTLSPTATGTDTCPNAAIRAQQDSGFLPDCRAYEMVSPPDKHGGDIGAMSSRTRAAQHLAAGEPMAVQFASLAGFADARSSSVATEYMGVRDGAPGTQGWSTHAITPPQLNTTAFVVGINGLEPRYVGEFSEDLSAGVFSAWSALTDAPNVQNVPNLYLRSDLRDVGTGSFELLSDCLSPPLGPCANPLTPNLERETYELGSQKPYFAGASSDLGRVVFESSRRLTSDSTAVQTRQGTWPSPNVYEWDHGTLRLASILPGGTPAPDAIVGAGAGAREGHEEYTRIQHAVSSDGRRIVFTEPEGSSVEVSKLIFPGGKIFLRSDDGLPDAGTVQVNASERTDCNAQRKEAEPGYACAGTPEPDPAGPLPAVYFDASADGSRVFFASPVALTNNAVPYYSHQGGLQKLYMYDVNAPAGHHLTLLTEFLNEVLGVSTDGRYVYFQTGEELYGSKGALYVWHDDGAHGVSLSSLGGVKKNGTREEGAESHNGPGSTFARVTPDGLHLLFFSTSGQYLTGYDHGQCPEGGGAPHPCRELYLYSAVSGRVVCVSCNPTGAPATRDADDLVGIMGGAVSGTHMTHPLSDDGRFVFFSTGEALVAQDTNGKVDAYEYDASSGEVHLLSSGTSPDDSYFLDASGDGRDVFIVTRERLVGWDVDQSYDLYDVRIDGGFANPPAAAAVCSGEVCQGNPGLVPGVGAPASLSAGGAGNVGVPAVKPAVRTRRAVVCARGKVRVRVRGKTRCVLRRHGRGRARARMRRSVRGVSGHRVGR